MNEELLERLVEALERIAGAVEKPEPMFHTIYGTFPIQRPIVDARAVVTRTHDV